MDALVSIPVRRDGSWTVTNTYVLEDGNLLEPLIAVPSHSSSLPALMYPHLPVNASAPQSVCVTLTKLLSPSRLCGI